MDVGVKVVDWDTSFVLVDVILSMPTTGTKETQQKTPMHIPRNKTFKANEYS